MSKKIDKLIEEFFEPEQEDETLDENSEVFSKFLGGRGGILRNDAKLNSVVLQESMAHPDPNERPARAHDKRYRESAANSTFWKKDVK